MIQREVEVPEAVDRECLQRWLFRMAGDCGATIGEPASLRTLAGSLHWHIRRGPGSGTLEVTFDSVARRVVVAVHSNRHGSWADAAIHEWTDELEVKMSQMVNNTP